MTCFTRDLKDKLLLDYAGEGKSIAMNFYIPVLKQSLKYDRISGYFSVDSLVITATGIAGLINNDGYMRLILGAHDFGGELVDAYNMSQERANEIIQNIGQRIVNHLDRIEDIIATRRLEAIAWMLLEKRLAIRIAIPRKAYIGSSKGIFHEKSLIFEDMDGCLITAVGSTNESRAAWDVNGENVTIFPSWNSGVYEYIRRHREQFEVLWNGQNKDYYTFTIPEALSKKISEKFYRPDKPKFDPYETVSNLTDDTMTKLGPAASLMLELGKVKGLAHLGLGPVSLYPHQAYVVEKILSRYPYRALLADEVGLGKTLEAGAIIKRLIDNRNISRVCILTPKNVAKQWLDEMWKRFGLNFVLFASNPKRFITSDEQTLVISEKENPFDKAGYDLVIASWHYARGTKSRGQEILQASKFFDLIVIDEAHAARRRWGQEPPTPTKLKILADELAATSPHILLMSATPIQLDEREALDILEILGLGGKWIHESNFSRYYSILKKNVKDVDIHDWIFALELASYLVNKYMSDLDLQKTLKELASGNITEVSLLRKMLNTRSFQEHEIRTIVTKDPTLLRKVLIALNPMNWFMVRNTRDRLTQMGYKFPERIVADENVFLIHSQQEILNKLDDYLANYYGKYERLVSNENKGIIGFVRSIYHQRFTSSFASAYMTVSNRYDFLESLIKGDEESIKLLIEKILEEEEYEEDEEDIIDNMKKLVQQYRPIIVQEMMVLENLKSLLMPYSPKRLSQEDPKLLRAFDKIKENIIAGRKILVFSKYTDTIEAIRIFIVRKGIPKSRIGIYTGEGGRFYDSNTQKFEKCGKDNIKDLLDGNRIDVVLCSDAASEGLNLQSASVLINVDMPWNPAKVEQRIGRIDRLGQRAQEVSIMNIWYPDSIEARMYKMLFERREIYKLVVGPAQEIISKALRKSLDVGAKGLELEGIIREVQAEIEGIQKGMVEREGILEGISWNGTKENDNEAMLLTEEFLRRACYLLDLKFTIWDNGTPPKFHLHLPEKYRDLETWNDISLEMGYPNALTPTHPIVTVLAEEIAKQRNTTTGLDLSVYSIHNHYGLAELMVAENGSSPEKKTGTAALDVMKQLLEYAASK